MTLFAKLVSLFGKKQKPFNETEIKFHKEAIYFGEHGQIVVSNIKEGLREQAVRFVFVGLTTPPKLDAAIFLRIWEEAKNQGYIPHYIDFYGCDNNTVAVEAAIRLREERVAKQLAQQAQPTVQDLDYLANLDTATVARLGEWSEKFLQQDTANLPRAKPNGLNGGVRPVQAYTERPAPAHAKVTTDNTTV